MSTRSEFEKYFEYSNQFASNDQNISNILKLYCAEIAHSIKNNNPNEFQSIATKMIKCMNEYQEYKKTHQEDLKTYSESKCNMIFQSLLQGMDNFKNINPELIQKFNQIKDLFKMCQHFLGNKPDIQEKSNN